jgi:Trk-type K+ transport system membrane component
MDTLPYYFFTLNILNVLDKVLTGLALKNPNTYELNPIAKYIIESFGLIPATIIYTGIGFVLFYVVYKIVMSKRLYCEKNNMSPEKFFRMLNIVFCLVVMNNIYWLLR